MNTENIQSVLVVLDFNSASVNFYSLTKEEEQDIEKTLTDMQYNLDEIQYMYGQNIDSNIYDVQEAISWLQTEKSEELEASDEVEL